MTISQRRYDIDWLRILAFIILIGYHIAMYFVHEWGWHIKSEVQFVWLQDVMILTNQWRMSLLFFISAMALSLFELKYGLKGIIVKRAERLLIPLMLGIFVIVPPQLFIELQQFFAYEGSYWEFLSAYFNINTSLAPERHYTIGLLTWNHLWFLPYLFVYTVVLVAGRKFIKTFVQREFMQRLNLAVFVAILVAVTLLFWLTLRNTFPIIQDLISDWYNHARYFWVFVVGYCLPHLPTIWQRLTEKRWILLMIAIACYAFIIAYRHGALPFLAEHYDTSLLVRAVYGVIVSLNHWAWILGLLGLAAKHLRFSNRFTAYANKAILPWYILHQTIIIVVAAWLKPMTLPALVNFVIILSATLLGCFVGYEIIKRFAFSRWIFGVR